MPRVNRATTAKARHKKIIKLAKGYRGRAKNCFRIAIQKVEKGLLYAYRDRRNRKRTFRSLWIQRINAAVRSHGLSYSQFINALTCLKIKLNRKVLSNLAISNTKDFNILVNKAQAILKKKLPIAAPTVST